MDPDTAPDNGDAETTGNAAEGRWYKSQSGYLFVVLLFVASGLSSLVYQVVWTRSLVLVFGSTTFATSTVLAVFMGGLTLGSFLCGRYVISIKRPYLCYGYLEGMIGIWALSVPFLLDAALPVYKAAFNALHLSHLPFGLLRFMLCSLILIVPTTLMGATLPLLARFVTDSLDTVGGRVGMLYAANTLGAIAGAMLSGFLFIPTWGLVVATIIAVAINFTLTGLVIITAPFLEKMRGSLPSTHHKPAPLPKSVRVAVLAFALSGTSAMIYEVGWTRALLMVIGSSTYAFTIMLSSFLIGIFLGSLAFSLVVDRIKNHLSWFALFQFLICLTGIAAMASYNMLPWWNLSLNTRFPADPAVLNLIRFALASSILLPLTYCFGATFPLIVKAATRDLQAVGASVGSLYSANTLGAIAGAFLAGFVLIPLLGVERTIIVACMANLFIGLLVLATLDNIRITIKVLAVIACLAALFWTSNNPRLWNRLILLSTQQERRKISVSGLPFANYLQWKGAVEKSRRLMYWKDGASSTVGVFGSADGGHKSLVTNGHIDGSDGGDMSTQLLLATYPLLLKPEAKDIAVVGWGTGVSVGVCTIFPTRSITAIELEPAVVEATRFFHNVNLKPEQDQRVNIQYNDGRNYLLATNKKFDIIISEPSNPWQSGVCNLFTKEFFTVCKNRLKPGGIFSCWMQTVEIPPTNIKQVLKGLQSVFSNNLIIRTDSGNIAILSSDGPLSIDYSRLKRIMKEKVIKKELALVGIDSPERLLSRILITPSEFNKLTSGAKPNCDDTNKLEYSVGSTYEDRFYSDKNQKLFEKYSKQPWTAVDFKDMPAARTAKLMTDVSRCAAVARDFKNSLSWANESLKLYRNPEGLRLQGIAYLKTGRPERAKDSWNEAIKEAKNPSDIYLTRALASMYENNRQAAAADLTEVLKLAPENKTAHLRMAQIYAGRPVLPSDHEPLQVYSLGMRKDYSPETVLKWLGNLPEDRRYTTSHPEVLFLAAEANLALNQAKTAESQARRFISERPVSVAGMRLLGTILYSTGNTHEASSWWATSLSQGRHHADVLAAAARKQLASGDEKGALRSLTRALQLNPDCTSAKAGLESMASIRSRSVDIMNSFQLKKSDQAGD